MSFVVTEIHVYVRITRYDAAVIDWAEKNEKVFCIDICEIRNYFYVLFALAKGNRRVKDINCAQYFD